MPTYHITAPDGSVYEVNAPSGATEQDALAYVQANQATLPKMAYKPAGQAPKPTLKQAAYDAASANWKAKFGSLDKPAPSGLTFANFWADYSAKNYGSGKKGSIKPATKQSIADKQATDRVNARTTKQQAFFELTQGMSPFNLNDESLAVQDAIATGGQNALAAIGIGEAKPYGMGEAYNARMAAERDASARFRREKPVTAIASNVVGNVLNPVNYMGGGFVAKGANLAEKATRMGVLGGAVGAASGYGEGQGSERFKNALVSGEVGAVVGGVIPVAAKAAQKVAGATKNALAGGAAGMKRAADVRAVQNSGVDLTYGQMLGGPVKMAEDALANVSPAISKARTRGGEQFAVAAINNALKPIGAKVTAPAGREAVNEAINIVGNAYDKASRSAQFVPDQQFGNGIKALGSMLVGADNATREQAQSIANQFLKDPVSRTGVLTGGDLSAALAQIRKVNRAASSGANPNPFLSDFTKGLEREVLASIARQNPTAAKDLLKASNAYARMVRIEKASMGAGDGGVFSASQLQNAVKATAGGARRRDFARGNALMQDISEPAKNVLPSTVGSSGTAERGFMLALGTGAVSLPSAAKLIIAEGAATGLYSKPVLKFVNDLARAKNQAQAVKAINGIKQLSNKDQTAQLLLSRVATSAAQSRPKEQQNAQTQEQVP